VAEPSDQKEETEAGGHAKAPAHLRRADPVLARLIDSNPGFDPLAWRAALPELDAFGALVFQVIGQQLSLAATRSILRRLAERFDGRLPTPRQLLGADPGEIRQAGLSRRKIATLRELARRFLDALFDVLELETLADEELEARLTAVPGVGPWTVHGFLIIALGART
jgi:DNA-3-methyladenine glycosylase II